MKQLIKRHQYSAGFPQKTKRKEPLLILKLKSVWRKQRARIYHVTEEDIFKGSYSGALGIDERQCSINRRNIKMVSMTLSLFIVKMGYRSMAVLNGIT